MTAIPHSPPKRLQQAVLAVTLALILCGGFAESASAGSSQYTMRTAGFGAGAGSAGGENYRLTHILGHCRSNRMHGDRFQVIGNIWTSKTVCIVEFADFARFAELWFASDPTCDLDGSRKIDLGDLAWFAHCWLSRCPAGWQLD